MAEGFFHPTPAVRFWASMAVAADLWDYGLFTIVARYDDGIGLGSAPGAVPVLGGVLRERFEYNEGWDKTRTLAVVPIREFLVGDPARPLSFLLGAVALLLLIACANVSALVLGRALDRQGEVAVRAALGAGRWSLVRVVVAESLVLGLSGALLGAALAWWATPGVLRFSPSNLPRLEGVGVDAGRAC
jgi:ABC-type antimicrobial peptide transport system permease subunit